MKIVVIGAQAAGLSAAAKAKRLKSEVEITVYEKTNVISFGACGLPYFVGDFFSDKDYMTSRTVDQLRQNGINVKIKHEVLAVDTSKKQVTVKDVETGNTWKDSYDKLLLATGAAPLIPPICGLDRANVFTLKTMEDGEALKEAALAPTVKDVIIIGGGYIGLETAEAMHRLGKQVRVIQLDDRVLTESFDREIAKVIEDSLHVNGVKLHLSETVLGLEGVSAVSAVRTNEGEYPADLVILCTGVKPNTLFLQNTGLEMLGNGAIRIDSYARTNIEDIYAVGDCATVFHSVKQQDSYIPLATTANKLGRLVGENMVGGTTGFPGTLGTAAIKVFAVEAARTGITEDEAIKLGLDFASVFVKDKNHSNYLPGQTDIFAKLIYDKQTKQILGGQVAGGAGSALRVDALAVAIVAQMSMDQLAMMDFFYAPPFSRPWDVLNIAAGRA